MQFLSLFLVLIAFILVSVAVMYFATLPLSKKLYEELLVRTSPDKWRRENSCPTDAEYTAMYNSAVSWGIQYQDHTREISIENDGLTLCGRFTDFGSEKTVIIMCGRAEGCLYSYFYAEPYRLQGFNILVIDSRAHGNSEGMYSGMGYLEQGDVLKWMSLLHEQFHSKFIVLHGVCIGAACAVYTSSNNNCPEYLKGIVLDGIFYSFHKVFIQRFHTNKKPIFPVLYEIEYLIWKHTGVNIQKEGPFKYMSKIKVPTLFIHSKEDISSLPKYVPGLFQECKTAKKLVWMEKGAHSHLRAVNTIKYDASITNFVKSL